MSDQSRIYRSMIFDCRRRIGNYERYIRSYRGIEKRLSKSEDQEAKNYIAILNAKIIPDLESDIRIEHRLIEKIEEEFREEFFKGDRGESA